MELILFLLLGIAAVIILLLSIALFIKKDIAVEREIIIDKPNRNVFDYIKHIKNQDDFSKWSKMDPDMKKTYSGTDGTVGFISAWDSNNKRVGKGEQEIRQIKDGQRIDMDLRFTKPFESQANASMTTEPLSENQTKVKWGFKSKMKYPMNIMKLFMNMDKRIGKDLETGLSSLKKVLEK
jgi:hypothetical protein